jgi:hypothetical protein
VGVIAARGDIEAQSLLGSLHGNPPAVLARAASEHADVQYFVFVGVGPILPGLEPYQKPARTWTIPGTAVAEDHPPYRLAAFDFAKAYNIALAREERGVR